MFSHWPGWKKRDSSAYDENLEHREAFLPGHRPGSGALRRCPLLKSLEGAPGTDGRVPARRRVSTPAMSCTLPVPTRPARARSGPSSSTSSLPSSPPPRSLADAARPSPRRSALPTETAAPGWTACPLCPQLVPAHRQSAPAVLLAPFLTRPPLPRVVPFPSAECPQVVNASPRL